MRQGSKASHGVTLQRLFLLTIDSKVSQSSKSLFLHPRVADMSSHGSPQDTNDVQFNGFSHHGVMGFWQFFHT